MNFHDYLSELPLDDLKLIAATLEVRPLMISRAGAGAAHTDAATGIHRGAG